jgi:elongation factor 1-alpha
MELISETRKEWINLSTMGHHDHGKSTLVGFLLSQLGVISDSELKRIEEEARKFGKPEKLFAFIMDRDKNSRISGLGLDIHHYGFLYGNQNFMVVDCPGHQAFVRNMIQGVIQADAGILVVAADDYETALSGVKPTRKPGGYVMGQAREHIYMARTLGIEQLVVVISKMDSEKAGWDKAKFIEASDATKAILREAGFDVSRIAVVPVGGKPPTEYGNNVVRRQDKLDWFAGPTFLEALCQLKPPPRRSDLPLRLPVEKVYSNPHGVFLVCGKVETGRLTIGDEVIFEPVHKSARIRSIRMRNEKGPTGQVEWSSISTAAAGNIVGLGISRVDVSDPESLEGAVLSHTDNPPRTAKDIEARIRILWHPTKMTPGYSPMIHIGEKSLRCVLSRIIEKASGDEKPKSPPDSLTSGDDALVRLQLEQAVALEVFQENRILGRLLLRDHGLTVAGGTITSII